MSTRNPEMFWLPLPQTYFIYDVISVLPIDYIALIDGAEGFIK